MTLSTLKEVQEHKNSVESKGFDFFKQNLQPLRLCEQGLETFRQEMEMSEMRRGD